MNIDEKLEIFEFDWLPLIDQASLLFDPVFWDTLLPPESCKSHWKKKKLEKKFASINLIQFVFFKIRPASYDAVA